MADIRKENDMFLSTLLNPEATTSDLIANGINASNTGLLTPDVYKDSSLVQEHFKDKDGNFDQSAFEKAYVDASQRFDELTSVQSYSDLSKAVARYNPNDWYAPKDSKKMDMEYTIRKVDNPFLLTKGIEQLGAWGTQTKSNRELAQQSLIWDSEKNLWKDKTADELGLFGSIFSEPLVYAIWDSDGEHFDETLGRTVQHKKGQWKTKDGHFYTETIGNKQGYGKQFVALSDTLTKEDSWLNKIDVFDSDGLEKSAAGTTFKMAAQVIPYLVPKFNVLWGGVTAAIQLASVLPTFAKMIEGIVVGDDETGFTRSMNAVENYWSKYNDSFSEEAQQSNWGYEKMASMVGDIFGQLYQMRAFSKLSLLKNSQIEKAQAEAADRLTAKFMQDYIQSGLPEENMAATWQEMIAKSPEMTKLIKEQSELSKSLSLGYMALTSSADVYSDALAGGYDRRMAGLAALTATAGQYAIMMNDRMGDWFLDATTGYKENVNRNVILKALRPRYQELAETADAIGTAPTTEAKMNLFAKAFDIVYNKGIKNYFNILKNGGEEIWKRAIIEGTEEVTEEAVMDMSKGVFDFMSYLGIGKNSDTASFGGIKNVFSQSGLERYLMNAVGGAIGGTLFTMQQNIFEPAINKAIGNQISPDVQASLVHEIDNGHIDEIYKGIHEMCKADNKVMALPVELQNDANFIGADGNTITRGEFIEKRLIAYVQSLESMIVDNGLDLDDPKVFQKAIRDKALLPMLEKSEVHKLVISDFNKATMAFVKAKQEVDALEKKDERTESEEKELKEKQKTLKEAKEQLDKFLSGELDEKYLQVALAYLHPQIRNAMVNMDFYSYVRAKYGVEVSKLDKSNLGITEENAKKEYVKWKESKNPEQQFISIVVPAYNQMLLTLSPVVEEYINKYADVRSLTLRSILSAHNFRLGEMVQQHQWKGMLGAMTQALSDDSSVKSPKGATLTDIFQKDSEAIDEALESILYGYDDYFNAVAEVLEMPVEQVKDYFKSTLVGQLESFPIQQLNKTVLDNMMYMSNQQLAAQILKKLKENNPDGKITVEDANAFLQAHGLREITDPRVQSESDIANVFTDITAPKAEEDSEELFSKTVVMKYLQEQDHLDNEVVRAIKTALYNDIVSSHAAITDRLKLLSVTQSVVNAFDEVVELTGALSLSMQDWELFDAKLYQGLNTNKTLEEIVEDFLLNPQDGIITKARQADASYQLLELTNPNVVNDIRNIFLNVMSSSPAADTYARCIEKDVVNNPLFDFLRTVDQEVSEAGSSNLMDLLEAESSYLSKLSSSDEYIRQGVTLEQIENFEKLLDLAEAIISGMENGDPTMQHPISFNAQMQRYHLKYGDKTQAGKYKLITPEQANLLTQDLELLKNKLQLLRGLIALNTESMLSKNKKSQEVHQKLLLKFVKDKCSNLTINGISIFPSQDKVSEKTTDDEKIGFVEHEAYNNFQEAIKKSSVEDAVTQLFSQLHINADDIIQTGLTSNGIDSKTTSITGYDFLTYLATILGTDQHAFRAKYSDLLQQSWFNKVPFYVQEFAMKIGYSFYADTQGIHKAFVSHLFKDSGAKTIDECSRIMFIDGVSGAGKTNVVQSGIFYMMHPSEKILIAAPNTNQAEKLANSLLQTDSEGNVQIKGRNTKTVNLRQLLELFLTPEAIATLDKDSKNPEATDSVIKRIPTIVNKAGEQLYTYTVTPEDKWFRQDLKAEDIPSIIFFDEVTHINKAFLQVLKYAAEKYNFKMQTSGDTYQRGASVGLYTLNIDGLFTFKAPRLLMSIRGSNTLLKDNVDICQARLLAADKLLESGNTEENREAVERLFLDTPLELKWYESDDELHGTKVTADLKGDDARADLIRLVKAVQKARQKNPKAKIGILANLVQDTNGAWKLADTKFETLLQDLGLNEGDYTLYYSPDDFHKRAVQGSEEEYFIIKDLANLSMDTDAFPAMQSFYTYITRSMAGGIIQLDHDIMHKLGIIPKKMNYTDSYVFPGLSKLTELKEAKVETIKKVLDGWSGATTVKPNKPSETEAPQAEPAPAEPINMTPPAARNPQPQALVQPDENDLSAEEEQEAQEFLWNLESFGPISTEPDQKAINADDKDLDSGMERPAGVHADGFFEHLGLYKDEEEGSGSSYYATTNDGTFLDWDGLFPTKTRTTIKVRDGFKKFQKVISLYPDTNSKEFADAMFDDEIKDFFYFIDPELSTHHGEDEIAERRADVYRALVTEHQLKIDDTDYLLGKLFHKNSDFCSNILRDPSKEPAENQPTLFLGRRITITDKSGKCKVDQFISMGICQNDSNVEDGAKVTYQEVLKKYSKYRTEFPDSKLFIYKLAGRSKAIAGLQIYTPKDGKSLSVTLNDLAGLGYYFDPGQVCLITNETNENGEFKFLRWVANYEAAGNKTLADFKYAALEKKFTTNIHGVKVLKDAGRFFTIMSCTATQDPQFSRIIIFDTAEIDYTDAINQILGIKKNFLRGNTIGGKTYMQQVKNFSPYSQANFVVDFLTQVGALTPDGKEVLVTDSDGNNVSAAKFFLDKMRYLMEHANESLQDLGIVNDFLNTHDTGIDRDTILALFKGDRSTGQPGLKYAGLFFIEACVEVEPDITRTRLLYYGKNLTAGYGPNSDNLIPLHYTRDNFGRVNIPLYKKVDLPNGVDGGTTAFVSGEVVKDSYNALQRQHALQRLILKNAMLQAPVFNIPAKDVIEQGEVINKSRDNVAKIDFDDIKALMKAIEEGKNIEKPWGDREATFDPKEITKSLVQGPGYNSRISIDGTNEESIKEVQNKQTGKTYHVSKYPHVQNQFGLDITVNDDVCLFGDTDAITEPNSSVLRPWVKYHVRAVLKADPTKGTTAKIFLDKKIVMLGDKVQEVIDLRQNPNNDKDWGISISPEFVTTVTLRRFHDLSERNHDYYTGKDSKFKKAKLKNFEKLGTQDSITLKQDTIKSKLVSEDEISAETICKGIDFDKYGLAIIPFTYDQDYVGIEILGNDHTLTNTDAATTQEQLEKAIETYREDPANYAGVSIVLLEKSSKDPDIFKDFDAYKKKAAKETDDTGSINGMITKAIRFNRGADHEYTRPEPKAKTPKFDLSGDQLAEAVQNPGLGNYLEDDEVRRLVTADSIEELQARGFASALFVYYPVTNSETEQVMYIAYPKPQYFDKVGVPDPRYSDTPKHATDGSVTFNLKKEDGKAVKGQPFTIIGTETNGKGKLMYITRGEDGVNRQFEVRRIDALWGVLADPVDEILPVPKVTPVKTTVVNSPSEGTLTIETTPSANNANASGQDLMSEEEKNIRSSFIGVPDSDIEYAVKNLVQKGYTQDELTHMGNIAKALELTQRVIDIFNFMLTNNLPYNDLLTADSEKDTAGYLANVLLEMSQHPEKRLNEIVSYDDESEMWQFCGS